jgi:hypothetical protein
VLLETEVVLELLDSEHVVGEVLLCGNETKWQD